jgi:hypothetical protein
MDWKSFVDRPIEFSKKWLGQELNLLQQRWITALTKARGRQGLIYKRKHASQMATTMVCAALWRGIVHDRHSQIIVSSRSVASAWMAIMAVHLTTASSYVRHFIKGTEKGYGTQASVVIWHPVRAHPNNLVTGVKPCDLYIGDFDRIPRDLLDKVFEVDLGGLVVFPTVSGKWPHFM